jgi:hypothetical protein
MRRRSEVRGILVVVALLLGWAMASTAFAQWEIKTADGKQSIKFGFLAQMRADQEELANGDNAQNLYFRRLRLLMGGKLADKWTFFLETDSPNLGKSDATGAKNAGDIYFQDFFVTYTQSDAFKVDMGMILIPLSRNSTQSAATLLASDYGPYSFLESGVTQSRVGRDYGVQLRGGFAKDHFDYRLGVYDGARGENGTNDLRYAGRIMVHVFDPETGMFYTGNNLGGKHALSFGASFDVQDKYKAYGFDAFWDQPVGSNGAAFTFQGDAIQYDGSTTFTTLPKQDTTLAEVGFLAPGGKWQPWIQYATRNFKDSALADEDQLWVGINYRMAKHNRIFRLAYGKLGKDGASDRDVVQLTVQIFQF